MSVEIKYNDAVIASLEAGQTATLKCTNSLMTSDVIVTSDESAGGDSKINGIVEEYKVNVGANVSAGDFVEFITKFDSFSLETTDSPTQMNVCKINEEQILAVYYISTSKEIRATVITFKNGQIIVGTETVIYSSSNDWPSDICLKSLSNNKFIITFHSNSSSTSASDDFYGLILSITPLLEITIGQINIIYEATYLSGCLANDITVITPAMVIAGYSHVNQAVNQSSYTKLFLLTIEEDVINVQTTKNFSGGSNYLSLATIGENKIIFSRCSSDDGGIYTSVCNVSDGLLTMGSSLEMETTDIQVHDISSVKVDENQAIISYYTNATRYATLVNIVDDIVTSVSKVSIDGDSSNSHIIPLSTTKFLLVYSYYTQILTINETTITSSGQQRLKGSYSVRCLALSESSVMGVSNTSGLVQCIEVIDDTINQITGIQGVETYVQPITSSLHIGGIAKTSGISGEIVEVYRPIEKIKFQIDYDDGMFYEFEAEKGMTWGEFVDSKYNNYGDELSVYRSDLADDGNGNAAIGVSGELLYHGYDLTRLVYENDIIESMTYKSEYYNVSSGDSN